jgi:hypothetical protein
MTVQEGQFEGGVVRDPWFPFAMVLIVLLGAWLGILGPMPDGFTKWLQGWQTLIAAVVAAVAVIFAFKNTDRSLAHAERLEENRRRRKHAAVRAVLPLALSQVIAYADRSARSLNDLVSKCEGETLPAGVAVESLVEPLPSETLKSLADFIEYTDTTSVEVLESTVAWIQIFDSRMRALVQHNNDPAKTWVVVRTEIEGLIVDAATIYAGVASGFDYARRRRAQMPTELSWDGVIGALRNMRLWDDEYPRVYQIVEGCRTRSTGPFEPLGTA